MRKILVTGGTVFVSRYVAEYFSARGDDVYVLNRNTRPQSEGVHLIEADRENLGDILKDYEFDAVLDITGYTRSHVEKLVQGLGKFKDYIFLSSSAVYPETAPQPFKEEQPTGPNIHWGEYGTNKAEAERYLQENVPQAYILRPPYLYGPMQNLYREPFVFECAELGRPFYLPGEGEMGLQFCYIEDLCRFIEILLEKQPNEHIFNVGNPETVTVKDWVGLCYEAAGKELQTVPVDPEHSQRAYFCFHDYDYRLDVSKQNALLPNTIPLAQGLGGSYDWFRTHRDGVNRKGYFEYIDSHF